MFSCAKVIKKNEVAKFKKRIFQKLHLSARWAAAGKLPFHGYAVVR